MKENNEEELTMKPYSRQNRIYLHHPDYHYCFDSDIFGILRHQSILILSFTRNPVRNRTCLLSTPALAAGVFFYAFQLAG